MSRARVVAAIAAFATALVFIVGPPAMAAVPFKLPTQYWWGLGCPSGLDNVAMPDYAWSAGLVPEDNTAAGYPPVNGQSLAGHVTITRNGAVVFSQDVYGPAGQAVDLVGQRAGAEGDHLEMVISHTDAVFGYSSVTAYLDVHCAAPPPPSPTCPSSLLLLAKGSGQAYTGPDDLSNSPQLQTLVRGVNAAAGSARPQIRVIDYPSSSISVLTQGLASVWTKGGLIPKLKANAATYLAGTHQGTASMWAEFQSVRKNCGTAHISVAGYSQGAMVVHEFLGQLAKNGSREDKAALAGAVLIADPARVKNSRVTELSNAQRSSYGICDIASGARLAECQKPLTDVSPTLQARTVSVCFMADPACDTSTLLSLAASAAVQNLGWLWSTAQTVHSNYGQLPATTVAGRWLGFKTAQA